MNIFVLFGITGDLAKKKVIPAIARIERGSGSTTGEQIAIGVGRKKLPPDEFASLRNRAYIAGELDAISTYKKLKKTIYSEIARYAKSLGALRGTKGPVVVNIIAYSSLPPHLHVAVARLFASSVRDRVMDSKFDIRLRFLFEKPLGTDFASATRDIASLRALFREDQLYFVDHYLFKEPLVTLRNAVDMNSGMFSHSLGSSDISSIESVMYETVDVRGREAFYDAVGALNDIGQNHLLQMLAECIQMREKARGTKPGSVKTKAKIISSLKIVNDPVFGQYKGYAESDGVKPGSHTETFFRVEALYGDGHDKDGRSIKCVITGGKSLGIAKSGLILKNEKHGTESFIDMSAKGSATDDTKGAKVSYESMHKDAYVAVFEQAIAGNRDAFAREEEILAGWKFAKRAKQIRTRKNILYNDLRDIAV